MRGSRKFIPVHTYLPEQVFRGIDIRYKILTEKEARLENLRMTVSSMRAGMPMAGLEPDVIYTVLRREGRIWMSDTPMERNSNRWFVQRARGKVFIGGLGLGMCIMPLLNCDKVTSIEVWEIDQDLIDLISRYVKHDKLTIKQADVLGEIPDTSAAFDSVLLDIWSNICLDNYEEMKTLKRKWTHRLNKQNKEAFIDIWSYGALQRQKREEARETSMWHF